MSTPSRFWLWMAAWLLLAAGLRFAQLTPDTLSSGDSIYYRQIALRVADGQGLTTEHGMLPDPHPLPSPFLWKPPGYPLFLGAWASLGGRSLLSMRASTVLLGVGLVLLVGLLTRRLAGSQAGVAAAAVAATHPILIKYSTQVLPDMALGSCLVGAVLYAVRARQDGRFGCAVAAGALWGLAQAIKSIALIPAGIGMLYLVWPRRGTRRPSLALGTAMLAGFTPFVGGVLWRNLSATGTASGGKQGIVNVAQNWMDITELYYTVGIASRAAAVVDAVTLPQWIATWCTNLWSYVVLAPQAFMPLTLCAAAAGWMIARRRDSARAWIVPATVLAMFGLLAFRTWAQDRYLIPALALSCIWVGVLLDDLRDRGALPLRLCLAGGAIGLVGGWFAGRMVLTQWWSFTVARGIGHPALLIWIGLLTAGLTWRFLPRRAWPVVGLIAAAVVAVVLRPDPAQPQALPEARYIAPLGAVACLWAAAVTTTPGRRVLGTLTPVVLCVVVGYGLGARTRNVWWHNEHANTSAQTIGKLIRRDHTGSAPPVVMSRLSHPAYFADAWFVQLPLGDAAEVGRSVQRWDVDYVVLEDWWLALDQRIEQREWMEGGHPVWLQPLQHVQSRWYDELLRDRRPYGPYRIALFRVNKAHLPAAED